MLTNHRYPTEDEVKQIRDGFEQFIRHDVKDIKSLVVIGIAKNDSESHMVLNMALGRRDWICRGFDSFMKNSHEMFEIVLEVVGKNLLTNIVKSATRKKKDLLVERASANIKGNYVN